MDIIGFKFSAVDAAIKKPGRNDLALIFSEAPAVTAAVYTTNKIKAAPVLLGMERVQSGFSQAVVVNSGNANACTGVQGMADAVETARLVAEELDIAAEGVLVSSTGVIGVPLPMDRVRKGIPPLVAGLACGSLADVAQAIMTTDTFAKLEWRGGEAGGTRYTVAGIAKGAGMIMPNMATMLAFIVTDASVEPFLLRRAFSNAVNGSFNAITIDGDTSTNDTAIIMANGMAGNPVIQEETPECRDFELLLNEILLSLAKQIVRDGEGATKFVEITVKGATSQVEAKQAAMATANSLLVKTAFFGQDANWGRILAAIGYSGVNVDQARVALFFGDVQMVSNGVYVGGDAEIRGTEILKQKEFSVTVDLQLGVGSATVYTSDLSYDYVKINADYRT